MSLLQSVSHCRLNPLTGEWTLVSPHRMSRPWQGRCEQPQEAPAVAYEPDCYLCPGNRRANGERNPPFTGVYAFDNDFSALTPQADSETRDDSGLLVARGEPGRCRVLCYSPRHDLTLAQMEPAEIAAVVEAWSREYRSLGAQEGVSHVQIFENRGALMGASNPHPHGQIWATASLPNEVAKEDAAQAGYRRHKNACLLCEYLALEEKRAERVVCANARFVALVPFWAIWPFETLLLPRRHLRCFDDFEAGDAVALADILKRLTTRYDNLFETDFPYSMGFHQSPTDGRSHEHWHFHAHFYPPLLRSATVRKFMVGFELLGSPQRDLTPEAAAERLRGVTEIHYCDRASLQT